MTREEAIQWVNNRMCWGRGTFTENHPPNFDECWEAGYMAIEALKNDWIPVSERLPEDGYWLWSAVGGEVKKDFYWKGHWEQAEELGYEVIAWRPLPEPYRESEE